jgi:multidrug transporter EmrE-like cation transporter
LSVNNFIQGFGGQIWPSRLVGFGVGVIVFTLMSHFLFKEQLDLKNGICLGLGLTIILVQLFVK